MLDSKKSLLLQLSDLLTYYKFTFILNPKLINYCHYLLKLCNFHQERILIHIFPINVLEIFIQLLSFFLIYHIIILIYLLSPKQLYYYTIQLIPFFIMIFIHQIITSLYKYQRYIILHKNQLLLINLQFHCNLKSKYNQMFHYLNFH